MEDKIAEILNKRIEEMERQKEDANASIDGEIEKLQAELQRIGEESEGRNADLDRLQNDVRSVIGVNSFEIENTRQIIANERYVRESAVNLQIQEAEQRKTRALEEVDAQIREIQSELQKLQEETEKRNQAIAKQQQLRRSQEMLQNEHNVLKAEHDNYSKRKVLVDGRLQDTQETLELRRDMDRIQGEIDDLDRQIGEQDAIVSNTAAYLASLIEKYSIQEELEVEEPVVQPGAEEPKPEEPVVQPGIEEPKPEEPAVQPGAEKPKPEEPVVQPEAEEPKPEEPATQPRAEEPKPEEPATQPRAEEPKPEEPAPEPVQKLETEPETLIPEEEKAKFERAGIFILGSREIDGNIWAIDDTGEAHIYDPETKTLFTNSMNIPKEIAEITSEIKRQISEERLSNEQKVPEGKEAPAGTKESTGTKNTPEDLVPEEVLTASKRIWGIDPQFATKVGDVVYCIDKFGKVYAYEPDELMLTELGEKLIPPEVATMASKIKEENERPSAPAGKKPEPAPAGKGTPAPKPEGRGTPAPKPEGRGTPAPKPEERGTPAPKPEGRGTPAPEATLPADRKFLMLYKAKLAELQGKKIKTSRDKEAIKNVDYAIKRLEDLLREGKTLTRAEFTEMIRNELTQAKEGPKKEKPSAPKTPEDVKYINQDYIQELITRRNELQKQLKEEPNPDTKLALAKINYSIMRAKDYMMDDSQMDEASFIESIETELQSQAHSGKDITTYADFQIASDIFLRKSGVRVYNQSSEQAYTTLAENVLLDYKAVSEEDRSSYFPPERMEIIEEYLDSSINKIYDQNILYAFNSISDDNSFRYAVQEYISMLSQKPSGMHITYDFKGIYSSEMSLREIRQMRKLAKAVQKSAGKDAVKIKKASMKEMVAGTVKRWLQPSKQKKITDGNEERGESPETTRKPENGREAMNAFKNKYRNLSRDKSAPIIMPNGKVLYHKDHLPKEEVEIPVEVESSDGTKQTGKSTVRKLIDPMSEEELIKYMNDNNIPMDGQEH